MLRIGHRNDRKLGLAQRCARECGQLARHAINAQAMRQIGRELEREQGVVQVQVRANVLTDRRISGQLQQTAVVVSNVQLFGRAKHALAFHAAQLAQFDQERFAVGTSW